jgi:hypothetical protein
VDDAKITVHACVPTGHVAVVVVGVDVVGVDVVGVEVVGVEVVGVVAVVPEVTVSKPVPVPVPVAVVEGVEVVEVVEVPDAVVVLVVELALLLWVVTATARKPVPRASTTSASAMTRAPLPVAKCGAFEVGAPHSKQ